jgi:hypothetical protein
MHGRLGTARSAFRDVRRTENSRILVFQVNGAIDKRGRVAFATWGNIGCVVINPSERRELIAGYGLCRFNRCENDEHQHDCFCTTLKKTRHLS